MPGICSHEFFWPRRAADGRYYQVCRLCDAEYEYDWNSMQRTAGASKTCSTPSSSDPSSHLRSLPRLNLLLELEPAHRVFIRNLADTFFHRTAAIATTSAPVSFWRDVFVHSGLPWRRFGESLLYHVIAIASVLVLSHTWVSQDRPSQRRAFDKSYISYYRPSQSFPALRGSTPRARSASKNQPNSAHQDPIHVTPERQQAAIKPPSVSLAGLAAPKIVASNRSLPVMPLLATSRPRLSEIGRAHV